MLGSDLGSWKRKRGLNRATQKSWMFISVLPPLTSLVPLLRFVQTHGPAGG